MSGTGHSVAVAGPGQRPRLVLVQPDIAQNVGTVLRLCACFALRCAIIAPAGFPLDDRRMRRAGMDYIDRADWQVFDDWAAFAAAPGRGRLVLATTAGATALSDFAFAAGDEIVLGSESGGVPAAVHAAADWRVRIPQAPGTRSLNVAAAAAILAAEALRQTGGFADLR